MYACSISTVLSTGCNWDISPVDNTVKMKPTLTVFSIGNWDWPFDVRKQLDLVVNLVRPS